MGMVRSRPAPGFWIDTANIDDLYGIRYDLALFQRDEVDRALVTFYAKLAQGMTRDTFISAEGTAIMPLDPRGRQMYMPPNSAGNAHFLFADNRLDPQRVAAELFPLLFKGLEPAGVKTLKT